MTTHAANKAAHAADIVFQAKALCDDPVGFFGTQHQMDHVPRDELSALQLQAVKLHFDQFKNSIPMLQKLVDGQGIKEINAIDDIVPLLFEHSMYKAYPPFLLEKNRFQDINNFIQKLTTVDISGVDVSGCESIDEWVDTMDEAVSELRICHSSGTTGSMSFLPLTERDFAIRIRDVLLRAPELDDSEGKDEGFYCIYPYFRTGASAHLRVNEQVINLIAGSEERFIPAFPGRMSSDVLYLAARLKAAENKGKAGGVKISPAMRSRMSEFAELQANMPTYLEVFFEKVVNDYAGKRVFLGGTWNLLHGLAKKGLEKGIENVFSPASLISTGGGAKGLVQPPDWEEDVRRFYGVEKLHNAYAMSEGNGAHYMCEKGHYHFCPWTVPYLLDPDSSDLLPRSGKVTGRAAFFDLSARVRWGGIISGDEITVNWDEPCGCGRQSAYVVGGIERLSEKRGGDDKITCAATESIHKEAMDFLVNFE